MARFIRIRTGGVGREVGEETVPTITGVISKRLRPNSLFEDFEIGALINASVSKLAAVPNPDCARTDVLVSVDDNVPVRIKDTTSACGSEGSELTLVVGCVSGPSKSAVTRYPRITAWPSMFKTGSAPRRGGK